MAIVHESRVSQWIVSIVPQKNVMRSFNDITPLSRFWLGHSQEICKTERHNELLMAFDIFSLYWIIYSLPVWANQIRVESVTWLLMTAMFKLTYRGQCSSNLSLSISVFYNRGWHSVLLEATYWVPLTLSFLVPSPTPSHSQKCTTTTSSAHSFLPGKTKRGFLSNNNKP